MDSRALHHLENDPFSDQRELALESNKIHRRGRGDGEEMSRVGREDDGGRRMRVGVSLVVVGNHERVVGELFDDEIHCLVGWERHGTGEN